MSDATTSPRDGHASGSHYQPSLRSRFHHRFALRRRDVPHGAGRVASSGETPTTTMPANGSPRRRQRPRTRVIKSQVRVQVANGTNVTELAATYTQMPHDARLGHVATRQRTATNATTSTTPSTGQDGCTRSCERDQIGVSQSRCTLWPSLAGGGRVRATTSSSSSDNELALEVTQFCSTAGRPCSAQAPRAAHRPPSGATLRAGDCDGDEYRGRLEQARARRRVARDVDEQRDLDAVVRLEVDRLEHASAQRRLSGEGLANLAETGE